MSTSRKLRVVLGYGIVTGTAALLGRFYPTANDLYSALIWVPILYPVFLLGRLLKNGIARIGKPRENPRSLDFMNRG